MPLEIEVINYQERRRSLSDRWGKTIFSDFPAKKARFTSHEAE
jgi:hypothetical protein